MIILITSDLIERKGKETDCLKLNNFLSGHLHQLMIVKEIIKTEDLL